jgi:hypothetical protein
MDTQIDYFERAVEAQEGWRWPENRDLAMAVNLLDLPATEQANKAEPRPATAVMLNGEGRIWIEHYRPRFA